MVLFLFASLSFKSILDVSLVEHCYLGQVSGCESTETEWQQMATFENLFFVVLIVGSSTVCPDDLNRCEQTRALPSLKHVTADFQDTIFSLLDLMMLTT
jgi:hypothetical protein